MGGRYWAGDTHSRGPALNPRLSGLAANPALPAEMLDRLVRTTDPELAWDLAGREDLTRDHAETLLAQHGSIVLIRLLPHIDPAIVPLDNPALAIPLVEHPAADPSWARVLAASPDVDVRLALALKDNLPADVIEKLAHDEDAEVVSEVAGCQPLTPELIDELAEHPSQYVRNSLAHNSSLPPDKLLNLVDGMTEVPLWIQFAMAYRSDLPDSVYDSLAESEVPGMRCELARNPAIRESVLRSYATDPDPTIRRNAALNPALPLDLLSTLGPTTRTGPEVLPRIAAASTDELRTLASSSAKQVRRLVAQRPDLPTDLVDSLAQDPDPGVGKYIVTNPALSTEQLWALIRRQGLSLYPQAAKNPNCPPDLLRHMLRNGHNTAQLHREIAKHPNLPADLVVELLDNSDEITTEAAAANPALPVPIMETLVTDLPG